ncbi:hypothetical protein OPV22_015249 [Ensete ventricosum]|uniref:Uncharacterized protein n=1 Tax=Ensete ventricosum TaxID=4639 RepID=A0AAV8RBG8_ENSVE|nr:hypothetical protein OPV22_015249 [Ensete ventricosum]
MQRWRPVTSEGICRDVEGGDWRWRWRCLRKMLASHKCYHLSLGGQNVTLSILQVVRSIEVEPFLCWSWRNMYASEAPPKSPMGKGDAKDLSSHPGKQVKPFHA